MKTLFMIGVALFFVAGIFLAQQGSSELPKELQKPVGMMSASAYLLAIGTILYGSRPRNKE